MSGGGAASGGGGGPPGAPTWARRRRAPMRVAWMVATLRSTLVLSTLGMPCLSARRARYSCGRRPWAAGQGGVLLGTATPPRPNTHTYTHRELQHRVGWACRRVPQLSCALPQRQSAGPGARAFTWAGTRMPGHAQ